MKMVTIYASSDLENRVVSAIQDSGADTYLTIDNATAHRFNRSHDLPRTMTWSAVMFLVPGLSEAQASRLSEALRHECDASETQPCLRLTMNDVDSAW